MTTSCSCCLATAGDGYPIPPSCTHPYSIVRNPESVRVVYRCPYPPKLSYSATSEMEPRGLLESQNVYLAEHLLRVGESIGSVNFFRTYQAGFSLAYRDPQHSVCGCDTTESLSQEACPYISALMTTDISSSCPKYSINQDCALPLSLCRYFPDTCTQMPTECLTFTAPISTSLPPVRAACGANLSSCHSVDGLSSDTLQVCMYTR